MPINISEIKSKIYQFQKNPLFVWSWRISFVSLGLSFLLFIFTWKKLPPQVPFFYSLPWGEEQLTNSISLAEFLGIMLLVYCLISIGALLLHTVSKLYAQILVVAATMLTLMSVYTVVRIILLII